MESLDVLIERVDGNVKHMREVLEAHVEKTNTMDERLARIERLRDRAFAWTAGVFAVLAAWGQRKEILSWILAILAGCHTSAPVVSQPIMRQRPVRVFVDPAMPECEQAAVSEAVRFWASSGVSVSALAYVEGQKPDIGDVLVLDGDIPKRGVVGYTLPVTVLRQPGRTDILVAFITLDACSPWVAAHELGHALGLRHRNDKGALMYPTVQGGGWLVDEHELSLVSDIGPR